MKGVEIEFDHDRSASILGVPERIKSREYIKDAWEESKYTKPLEITRRFANNETLTIADHELPYGDWLTMVFEEFGVPPVDKKGEEPKRYDYFRGDFPHHVQADKREWCLMGWNLEKTEEEMMWLMLRKKRMRKKEEIRSNLIGRLSLMRLQLRGNPDQMSSFMMLKWMWRNQ
ncbi:hypothetical protein Dimus_010324 [Dionaea muscipula]